MTYLTRSELDARADHIAERTGFLGVDRRVLRAAAFVELCKGVQVESRFRPVEPQQEWSPYP